MPEPDMAPETQDKPEVEPTAPAQQEADKAPQTDVFDEKFDPSSLPEELRPGWNQLRGDYTRKTQELAQQRQEVEQEQQLLTALRSNDPDLQRQALEFLGYDVPDDEPEEPQQYEDDPTEQRLAALEQAYQQQFQQAQTAELEGQIMTHLDQQHAQLAKDTGREFSQEEQYALDALAVSIQGPDGLPDVRAAYEHLYNAVLPQERKRWVQSKRNATQAPVGTSGSPTIDMKDDQARRAFLAQQIEAGMTDE